MKRDPDDYSAEFPFPPSGEDRAVPVAAPGLLGSGPAGCLHEAIPASFSPDVRTFALTLPESAYAILALTAAHDRVAPGDLVARLVCQHAERVGLPRLLGGGIRGASG